MKRNSVILKSTNISEEVKLMAEYNINKNQFDSLREAFKERDPSGVGNIQTSKFELYDILKGLLYTLFRMQIFSK